MSQSTRALDMRRSRYRGEDKTRFQRLMVATVINVIRAVNWLAGGPPPQAQIARFVKLTAASLGFANSALITLTPKTG